MEQGSVKLPIGRTGEFKIPPPATQKIDKIHKNVQALMTKHGIEAKELHPLMGNQITNYRLMIDQLKYIIDNFRAGEDEFRKDLVNALKPLAPLFSGEVPKETYHKERDATRFLMNLSKVGSAQEFGMVPDVPLSEIFRRFLKNL